MTEIIENRGRSEYHFLGSILQIEEELVIAVANNPRGVARIRADIDHTHYTEDSRASCATFDVEISLPMSAEFEAEITKFIRDRYHLDSRMIGCISSERRINDAPINTYRWQHPISRQCLNTSD